jgi:chemotaxis protein histidine kinase CheA
VSKRISPELLAGFAAEATDLLVRIAANVEQVNLQPDHANHLDEARRAAHQAKGAASMIGLADLAHVFYFMEEALEEMCAGRAPWGGEATAVFESCVLQLGDCLNRMSRGEIPDRILTPEALEALESLRGLAGKSVGTVVRVSPPSRHGAGTQPEIDTGMSIPAELLEVFRMEAEEHLGRIGENLSQLERQPGRQDLVLEVRRSVHTLKGASGSVGFRELSRMSHRMEDLLDRLSETSEPLSQEHRSLLVSTFDALCDMSAGGQDPGDLRGRIRSLYNRYDEQDRSATAQATARETAGAVAEVDTTPGLSVELIESFRQETDERLQSVQEQLRMLEANPADADLTLAIRRSIHTVKGASAMVGHVSMSRLAHRMEDLLDALATNAIGYDDETKNLLYLAADALTDLAATAGGKSQLGDALNEIVDRFDRQLSAVTAARAEVDKQHAVAPLGAEPAIELPQAEEAAAGPVSASSASGRYVRVPIERLDELVRFVSELVVNRSTFEQYLGSYTQEMRELDLSIIRIKRISQRLDTDVDVTPLRSGIGRLSMRGMIMPPGRSASGLARSGRNRRGRNFGGLRAPRAGRRFR